MDPRWAKSLRDQCAAAGVPFLFKQWGEWYPIATDKGDVAFEQLGKRRAGRHLDGKLHDGFPGLATP